MRCATFIESYDRTLLADETFPRRIMGWTLLHDFGTDAIAELLDRTNTPTPVENVRVTYARHSLARSGGTVIGSGLRFEVSGACKIENRIERTARCPDCRMAEA